MNVGPGKQTATMVGTTAVLLWSLLALFTTEVSDIPPFQLVSLCFSIASILSCIWIMGRGGSVISALRQPLGAWILGVGGLFGYHFFYFVALANAPAVEASLIAYLWPLFIVLFSALLPGERLRWYHVAGGVLGLTGAVLLVSKGKGLYFDPAYAVGYGAAIVCSFLWSGYSVLNRRYAYVPVNAVCGFCAGAAVLGFITHGMTEIWVVPDMTQWLAILALGLGPVGAAFFVWDYGTKHGDIQILGVASYGAPLLSTCFLIAFGKAVATPVVVAGCFLIVTGAILASKELLFRPLRNVSRK
ncbi:aromatic amino acid exporter YddG [Thalassospira aquimaris]|uniref:Membrane protein n=3 Tax=Thalassospira TaxID=168934 RepID=A0A367W250_9PROT|nr:EamA family transporter [Thalassospira sp. FZY0004]MDG4721720.1 EamA family transporter [Thalassospira sp. FZY0004]RCK31708.1 membrane protein [Thalassospira profundimaris]